MLKTGALPHRSSSDFSFSILISDIIVSTHLAHTDRDSVLLCFDHLSVSNIDRNVSRSPADISRSRVAHDRTAVLDRRTLSWDRDTRLCIAPLDQAGAVKGDIRNLRPPDIGRIPYLRPCGRYDDIRCALIIVRCIGGRARCSAAGRRC